MVIQHNMTAANTNRMLGITNNNVAESAEKLSSGYKINRAADNAAGLKISEKMRSEIRGLNQASINAQDGISMVQTAEGALNETSAILQRMRELTVQAANETSVEEDRQSITEELNSIEAEIDRISQQTEFNTMKILNADPSNTDIRGLQVGINSDQTQKNDLSGFNNNNSDDSSSAQGTTNQNTISQNQMNLDPITIERNTLSGTVYSTLVNESNTSPYDEATQDSRIDVIDGVVEKVKSQRSSLGAIQNRLEDTIANADNVPGDLQTAESRIRDVDMAAEMVASSKDGILQQAAQSMLAQANQASQGVLSLLR